MAADHGRADVDRARDRSSSGDEQGGQRPPGPMTPLTPR
jgi:hypothetical protein